MKNLRTAYLLDFYDNMLSSKQREILDMYYREDMSLAEISSEVGMTRQGVYDYIKRGEKEITSMEDKMRLMDRFLEISKAIDTFESLVKCGEVIDSETYDKIKSEIEKIKSLI